MMKYKLYGWGLHTRQQTLAIVDSERGEGDVQALRQKRRKCGSFMRRPGSSEDRCKGIDSLVFGLDRRTPDGLPGGLSQFCSTVRHSWDTRPRGLGTLFGSLYGGHEGRFGEALTNESSGATSMPLRSGQVLWAYH